MVFKALPMVVEGRPTLDTWCPEIERVEDLAKEVTNTISELDRGTSTISGTVLSRL